MSEDIQYVEVEPFETVWFGMHGHRHLDTRILITEFQICPERWDFVVAVATLLEPRKDPYGATRRMEGDVAHLFSRDWPQSEHLDKIKPEWVKAKEMNKQ